MESTSILLCSQKSLSAKSSARDAWNAPSVQFQSLVEGTCQFGALVLPSAPVGYRPYEIEEFLRDQMSSTNRSHRRNASNSSVATTVVGGGGASSDNANLSNDKKRESFFNGIEIASQSWFSIVSLVTTVGGNRKTQSHFTVPTLYFQFLFAITINPKSRTCYCKFLSRV